METSGDSLGWTRLGRNEEGPGNQRPLGGGHASSARS